MGDNNNLPPGFRFYPTDEELVVHFLQRRATLLPCNPDTIPDLDLFPYDPWHLHGKALSEGRKWYYYSRRTQSRVSQSGHWKSMGLDEPIFSSSNGRKVGMKKYFMFYIADPSSSSEEGSWTNWIMHEYRLSDSSSTSTSSSKKSRSKSKDHSRWVICKVYEQTEDEDDDGDDGTELSCLDEVFLSMDDDYDEISFPR